MKTSELKGTALDWAVAKCEEFEVPSDWLLPEYNPSTNWQLSGAIIERERISIENAEGLYWVAAITYADREYGGVIRAEEQGDTPLEAAMRCYVASKLGNEVEIPEGLHETT
jgi:hypothetical protein